MTKRVTFDTDTASFDAVRYGRRWKRYVAARIAFEEAYKGSALTAGLCRELAQARAALKMACSVHVSGQDKGE